MEQTVNTFNKGLQMDTHPMVQGNDTLSDALNATFITQNGNEVILQNDMGNRKIDNAYLPTGYQPVGMKEYGGIIYVAAYNPITNKSQIGSFPSPERRIGEENSDLGGNLNLLKKMSRVWQPNIIEGNSSTNFTYKKSEGIKFLNEDSLLINLTSDTSLHAGDKFSVYSSDIWEWKGYITNFSNTLKEQSNWKDLVEADIPKKEDESDEDYKTRIESYQDKIYSPKNKLYTLQLGILNFQNEFVDITNSLERWDDPDKEEVVDKKTTKTSDNIISFNNESDLYKFNKGYFIAKEFNNSQGEYTGNDAKLIAERQKMTVNTYAYKLVGPLYLKATLNHVKDFSYTIEGVQTGVDGNKNLKAEITIIATITYNCPDGIIYMEDNSNDTYFTLGEGIPENYKWFSLFYKNESSYIEEEDSKENKKFTIISKSKYNEVTNLYTVIVSKTFEITANRSNKYYDYYLCVPAFEDVYLEGLSTKETLNLELLGSGQLELIGWRFWNGWDEEDEISGDSKAIITYIFENYPKYNHSFRNLRFKFKNVTDANNTNIKSNQIVDELIPTRGNKEFNWREFKDIYGNELLPRTLYEVTILYDEYEGDQIAKDKNNQELKDLPLNCGNLFFLTTNLFNDCYNINNSDFVNDYRIFTQFKDDLESEDLKNIWRKYLEINPNIKPEISLGKLNLINSTNSSSNLFSINDNSADSTIISVDYYQVPLSKSYYRIFEEIKYPKFITYSNEFDSDFNFKESFNYEFDNQDQDIKDYVTAEINEFNINIQIQSKYISKKSKSKKSFKIKNGFVSIDKAFEELTNGKSFGGVAPRTYKKNWKSIYVVKSSVNKLDAGNDSQIIWQLNHPETEKKVIDSFYDYEESIFQSFNDNFEENIVIYGFIDNSNFGGAFGISNNQKNFLSSTKYSRIWVRLSNEQWAQVNFLIQSNQNIVQLFKDKKILDPTIFYSLYKDTNMELYYPDINNEKYNEDYIATIKYKLEIYPKQINSSLFTIANNFLPFYIGDTKSITITKEINISSPDNFKQNISNLHQLINDGELINIILDDLIYVDKNGSSLNPEMFYIKDENGYSAISSDKYVINNTYSDKLRGFTFAFKSSKRSRPTYQWDWQEGARQGELITYNNSLVL